MWGKKTTQTPTTEQTIDPTALLNLLIISASIPKAAFSVPQMKLYLHVPAVSDKVI